MASSRNTQPPEYRLDGRYRHVERYLDQLGRLLPGGCREELVAEARRHLFDATEAGVETGLPPERAQREAIRAFGSAPRIALAAWRAQGILRPPWAALRARFLGTGSTEERGAPGTRGEMTT